MILKNIYFFKPVKCTLSIPCKLPKLEGFFAIWHLPNPKSRQRGKRNPSVGFYIFCFCGGEIKIHVLFHVLVMGFKTHILVYALVCTLDVITMWLFQCSICFNLHYLLLRGVNWQAWGDTNNEKSMETKTKTNLCIAKIMTNTNMPTIAILEKL